METTNVIEQMTAQLREIDQQIDVLKAERKRLAKAIKALAPNVPAEPAK